MEKTKVLVNQLTNKKTIIALAKAISLIAIAVIVPLFHCQPITGPIVNAVLFISVALLGLPTALFICLIPSVIALSFGLLPPVLAPIIPFIMISNALLIIVFNWLRDKNYWLGVVVSSGLKAIFLFSTSSIVINLLLNKAVASKVAIMMSWPQLITALVGGVLAYLFLRIFNRQIENFKN